MAFDDATCMGIRIAVRGTGVRVRQLSASGSLYSALASLPTTRVPGQWVHRQWVHGTRDMHAHITASLCCQFVVRGLLVPRGTQQYGGKYKPPFVRNRNARKCRKMPAWCTLRDVAAQPAVAETRD